MTTRKAKKQRIEDRGLKIEDYESPQSVRPIFNSQFPFLMHKGR
jgi:hypothetical protein